MSLTLNIDQLEALSEKVMQKICEANRNGSLTQLMANMGWQELLNESCNANDNFHSLPIGNIVVLGGSEVKERHLRGVCKELGFTDKERFEFYLDYETLQKFKYKDLQWNDSYRVLLVGPAPHKTSGTGEYASLLSALENEPGFPRIVKMATGNELKITKSNFKAKLTELLESGFLAA